MQTYTYEVLREPGEAIRGEIQADDPTSAVRSLLSRGYHVLRIEDANSCERRWFRADTVRGRARRQGLLRFSRGLAALLRAGLPLASALGKLRDQSEHRAWRGIVGGLKARLEDGSTFSDALSCYPRAFDPLYVNLVRVGEASGRLTNALTRLITIGERLGELRTRVTTALVYPCAMLALGLITVCVLVTFVVPTFASVFRESGQQLPLPTQMLLTLSSFAAQSWPILFASLLALAWLARRAARTPNGQWIAANLLLRLPLVQRLVRQGQIAAFTRMLGSLLESGLGAVTALEITAGTLSNPVFARATRDMAEAVRGGESLHKAAEASALLPPLVTSAIALGEESGELAAVLANVAEETEADLDREVKIVMTLLEPVLIVLMGAVVGFIVMAMILPIFALGDTLPM